MQFKLASCSEPTTITRNATIRGLLAMGWFEYDKGLERVTRTIKYRIFSSPNGIGYQYLIGKSGALRKVNNGGTIAGSLSLTGGRIHAALCELGNCRFKFESTEQATETFHRILG